MEQIINTEILYKQFGPMVSKISRRMIQNEEVAKEAAQEVWHDILKNLSSFRGESKISTWIYVIAKRTALHYGEKEKIITGRITDAFGSLEEIPCPRENLQDTTLWVKEKCDNCITGTLHCLSSEDRLCKILKDFADLSYEEIAQVMEKDEAAVRKIISRARRKVDSFYRKDCAIVNPHGNCRCRIKKHVVEINLPQEYEKIRKTIKRVSFLKPLDDLTLVKNYWEELNRPLQ